MAPDLSSAHPRGSGDPVLLKNSICVLIREILMQGSAKAKNWMPAFAGMSGIEFCMNNDRGD
jgi:hypothetical protein